MATYSPANDQKSDLMDIPVQSAQAQLQGRNDFDAILTAIERRLKSHPSVHLFHRQFLFIRHKYLFGQQRTDEAEPPDIAGITGSLRKELFFYRKSRKAGSESLVPGSYIQVPGSYIPDPGNMIPETPDRRENPYRFIPGSNNGIPASYYGILASYIGIPAFYSQIPFSYTGILRPHRQIPRSYVKIPASYSQILCSYIQIPASYIGIPEFYIQILSYFIQILLSYIQILSFYNQILRFYTQILRYYNQILRFYTQNLRFYIHILRHYTQILRSSAQIPAFYIRIFSLQSFIQGRAGGILPLFSLKTMFSVIHRGKVSLIFAIRKAIKPLFLSCEISFPLTGLNKFQTLNKGVQI